MNILRDLVKTWALFFKPYPQKDHPNIMKVIEFYQDNKAFYIVSEFYNGGELFDKITAMRNFTEKQAATTMKQILSAVNYCHQNNIVHR